MQIFNDSKFQHFSGWNGEQSEVCEMKNELKYLKDEYEDRQAGEVGWLSTYQQSTGTKDLPV